MAIYCSIKNFIGSRNVTYKNQLDILSYMLPFVSFIIDATGTVAKVFKAVRADGHADQVLESLASLPPARKA